MKNMATGKAASPDGVIVEMLKALESFGITKIIQLANKIYAEGHFSTEMSKLVFITLPKKACTTKYVSRSVGMSRKSQWDFPCKWQKCQESHFRVNFFLK